VTASLYTADVKRRITNVSLDIRKKAACFKMVYWPAGGVIDARRYQHSIMARRHVTSALNHQDTHRHAVLIKPSQSSA